MNTQHSGQSVNLDERIGMLAGLGTDTALDLPPGLTLTAWAEIGATLVRVEKSIQWWLGDWWNYGERAYGEAASAAAPTGYSAHTCQKAAWVAERIEPRRRRRDLPFGHHDAVAGLDAPDQDKLLARAAAEDMSVQHVRAAARKIRASVEPDVEHDYRCPACGTEWDGSPRP